MAVFNAQNESGNTYNGNTGTYGVTDILLSKDIDIRSSNGQLFIAFAYQTGSTWQLGDSLTLELRTPSGNYQSVWKSPDNAISKVDVRIPLDVTQFLDPNFAFRFIAYSRAAVGNFFIR
jgi:hypothetical protein